jgi:hypothetical protein
VSPVQTPQTAPTGISSLSDTPQGDSPVTSSISRLEQLNSPSNTQSPDSPASLAQVKWPSDTQVCLKCTTATIQSIRGRGASLSLSLSLSLTLMLLQLVLDSTTHVLSDGMTRRHSAAGVEGRGVNQILCRICDKQVPMSEVAPHMQLCTATTRVELTLQRYSAELKCIVNQPLTN